MKSSRGSITVTSCSDVVGGQASTSLGLHLQNFSACSALFAYWQAIKDDNDSLTCGAAQGCSKGETREHVHSLICRVQGRQGQAILKHLQSHEGQEDGTASKM